MSGAIDENQVEQTRAAQAIGVVQRDESILAG
jgi:hypothetical protein